MRRFGLLAALMALASTADDDRPRQREPVKPKPLESMKLKAEWEMTSDELAELIETDTLAYEGAEWPEPSTPVPEPRAAMRPRERKGPIRPGPSDLPDLKAVPAIREKPKHPKRGKGKGERHKKKKRGW